MQFRPLARDDVEQIRLWRNEVPETLRTSFPLTAEQQEDYYLNVICDRFGRTRYWGIWNEKEKSPAWYSEQTGMVRTASLLIGYGGIENIQWENRLGEISILIGSEYRGKGCGKWAVKEILKRAFQQLNLENVFGECFFCSSAVDFWKKMIDLYSGLAAKLPGRKYWDGKYWDSLYFNFNKNCWRVVISA